MRYTPLLLVFILAASVSADECSAYRKALAVYKAADSSFQSAKIMKLHLIQAHGDLGAPLDDPDFVAHEEALNAVLLDIAAAARAARNDADSASYEAINAADLSPAHLAAILAASEVRRVTLDAQGGIISRVEKRLRSYPPLDFDFAPGEDASDGSLAAYDSLVLATACR